MKYRDVARRIENIVSTYDKRDLDEYLIGIAHNLEFQLEKFKKFYILPFTFLQFFTFNFKIIILY